MYEITIQHPGLHAYRVVKGHTPAEADLKAKLQLAKWEDQWQRVIRQRTVQQSKLHAATLKDQAKMMAEAQNEEAEAAVAAMDKILVDGVRAARPLDWETLKQSVRYGLPPPVSPQLLAFLDEPVRSRVDVRIPFFLGLIPGYRAKKLSGAVAREEDRYQRAHALWRTQKVGIEESNKKLHAEYQAALRKYQADKQLYEQQAGTHNENIGSQRSLYFAKQPDAIVDFCQLILERSQYPDSFPSNFQLAYLPDTFTIIVDYALPDVDALPCVRGYKFVSTKDEIVALPVAESWRNKTFDSVLFQITLRTLYELACADVADAIDLIVFNGWITSVDKAVGKETTACIMSIQAKKVEILDINMEQVDAKVCFKKLKGVSASKLINLSPIRPILQLNRQDSRFIPSHNVVDTLDESANLAAMDWEDFEHLIREVFEKEFSTDGSEVKITQASRDGGVDAVVFDPDPIRGGKIVIQAKRYTNTVSVSAVRDLYGTIMNEGANKGILVSTADYGPDAYEFAKGKPITLLNGNELLYLLQKHGHKARINLIEARMLAAEQAKAASWKG